MKLGKRAGDRCLQGKLMSATGVRVGAALLAGIGSIGPVQAQSVQAGDFSLEAYGTLLPFVDTSKTSGATAVVPEERPTLVPESAYTGIDREARQRVTVGTSNFGFRGSYAIDEHLQAVLQIESAIPVDDDVKGAPAGEWGNRDTWVGLRDDRYGSLLIGSFDTPYKRTTLALAAVRGINPFDYDALLENPGFNVFGTTTSSRPDQGPPGTNASFSRRQGNSLQYWSPQWQGVSFQLGYSVSEDAARIDEATTTQPQIVSGSVEYARGALVLRYAYEQHVDYFGLSSFGGSAARTTSNRSSTDGAHKLFLQYDIAATKTRIAAAVEQLHYENDDTVVGAVTEYERRAMYAIVKQKLGGAHNLWLAYGRADAGRCELVGSGACGTQGLGAQLYSLGYVYQLNGKVDLYGVYYSVENDESAQYGLLPSPGLSVAPGADASGFGFGILITFGVKLK